MKSLAIILLTAALYSTTGNCASESGEDPFEKQATRLETVVVETMQTLDRLSSIDKLSEAFNKLPASVHDHVGLRFYLVERKSNRIVVGEAARQVHLALDDKVQGLLPVALTESGEILFPASERTIPRHTRIVSNAKSNMLVIKPKIYIKLPTNGPLTLGYLHDASDPFLEAHKLFAGVLFRTFIGSTKPNCFGFSFLRAASVGVFDQKSGRPLWKSTESERITMPLREINGFPRNAEVRWSGNSPPDRVISCLTN